MKEVLRQHLPLGEIILDNEFFDKKEMKEFRPALNLEEFYLNCHSLIKLINGQYDVTDDPHKIGLPEIL